MAGISSRYWRLYISADNGGVFTSVSEMFLVNGGVDYTTSGKTYLGDAPFSGSLSQAFDATINGPAYPAWGSGTLPKTIGVDMGSVVTVDRIDLTISTSAAPTEGPKDFKLQYSPDGSTWIDAAVLTAQTGWTLGARRSYTIEAPSFTGVPTILALTLEGKRPNFSPPLAMEATPTQLSLSLQGGVPSTYSVGDVLGAGFITTTSILFVLPDTAVVHGGGFTTSLAAYGGAVITGTGFATTPAIFAQANNEFSIIGGGFTSTLNAVVISASDIMVRGRGFKSAARIYGGAVVSGAGFKTTSSIVASASERIAISGGNFATSFSSNAIGNVGISISGGGFTSILRRSVVTGGGFVTTTNIAFEFDANYAQAFVMNLNTNEVTRYTNYPFIHVARVGNEEYGFALDGIYRLSGKADGLAKVNGQITTKDTDFNTQDFDGFQSKNVPLLYANTDDTIKVTAIVDGVALPRQTSQFDGRKTKLSRGARGRYWAMKVENITKLQGLEFLPEKLQRRVK